ncbi:metallophosphatase [Variovorax paradoxus]|jgi:DNA repair exonuclease SbcCD nuclease subunit|uniref:metallophosphoesterase family protein n=1 Tax=Variovorax TaxID=34072 RepID=UPI0006E55F46|nr:metallophosphatase [Variovorax paradoxus]KPV12216.1 metallophosphatase [Variovorax paradoxus]KPV14069.1 metallophosphatase [Variovorax paradoxus]KPV20446.1 metallophosphatase [Variovorax paradoxus]KPV31450.1 metallophosphatase [Variovorax paradoxus]
MTRFLHTADWQIGRQFASFDPEHAPILAEARIAVVERLAALALEHRVDAVLVAGDVFDAQTVSERTLRRLFNALAAYSGPWLLIPGNHDAALAESVWTRAQRLGAVPSHVHLLLAPEPRLFEAQGFAVLPAPLAQRHTYNDLTAWFDEADTPAGLLRIGLAHGSVQGLLSEDIDSANPIAPERAASARLDYLALGDWHGCKRIDARTWYAGTPEPDRFKDNGSGQALLVEIDAPGAEPRVTQLQVGRFRWQAIAGVLQVATDVDALEAQLEGLDAHDVVDLRVQGRIDLAGLQRLQATIGRAEARARHLQADLSALRLEPTDEDIAGLRADGYLGEVMQELREAQAGADPAQARIAQDALALLAAELARGAAEGARP